MANFQVSTIENYSNFVVVDDDEFEILNGGELTINTSTADLRQIQNSTFGKLILENTSTTTPIFINLGSTNTTNRRFRIEAGAIMRGRGDKIQIGLGTGVAGQVVTLPQDAGLNNCPDLGGLWVEHGDTLRDSTPVYRPYLQVTTAVNAITLPMVSEIFTQDKVLNQVTFAKAIPLNAPIYMANIIIKVGDSISAGSNPQTDFNPSGTMDLEWVHWSSGFDLILSNSKQILLQHCAFARMIDDFNCANMVLPPVWKHCIFQTGENGNSTNLQNSPEAGVHINNWYDAGGTTVSKSGVNLQVTSNGYFEGCRVTSYGVTNRNATENSRGAFNMNGAVNITFLDCVVSTQVSALYLYNGSSNIIIDNFKFMSGGYSTDTATEDLYPFRSSNSSNVTVTRFHHQDPSVYGGGIYYGNDGITMSAGSNNITIDDVIFYAGVGVMGSVINDSSINSRVNNVQVYGTFSQRIIDLNTASLGLQVSNITTDSIQTNTETIDFASGTTYNQIPTGRYNESISAGAVGTGTDCISHMIYSSTDTNKTDARWHLRMSPTVNEVDYLTINTQVGLIDFTNNNRLYMSTTGDEIELESHIAYNVISAESFARIGSNASNWAIDFALRRPNGTYTSWNSTDVGGVSGLFNTALATLDPDPQNRVQIRYRINRTSSNVTNYLTGLYFNVTLSGEDYPFTLDPSIYTVSNLDIIDSAVNTGVTKYIVDTDTVTTFTIDGIIPTAIETIGSGSSTILGINNAKLVGTTFNNIGGTLVLGDGLNPSTNWSFGSDTLTLSGTETDLLGLRGLEQVDYAIAGAKIVYTVNPTTKVVISGTGDQIIDSDMEQLVLGVEPANGVNSLDIQSGGRLQVGLAKDVGGFTVYSGGPAIVFSNDSTNDLFTDTHNWANLIVQSGGRLDWYGGEIQTVGEIGTLAGSIIRTYSKEAMFVSVPSALQATKPEAYLRQDTTDIDVDGFTNKFGIYLSIGIPTSFKGYEPISSTSAIDMSVSSSPSTYYDYEDFIAGRGNTRDVGGMNDTWVRLLNTNIGSNITVTGQAGTGGTGQEYLVESKKSLLFTYQDENATIIQNAKVYLADTNHGSRLASNLVGTNVDYVADRVYTGLSNVSGEIDFTSIANAILLSVHYSTNDVADPSFDIIDYRGDANDSTDLFTFSSISYLHGIATVTIELKGIGIITQNQVLITETDITETNKTTVDAYTDLETSAKFYDYAKSYLFDNYQGETSTIVSKSGTLIDLGSYDLDIDATAGQVFDITGNKITIKASTFTGELTTTGTIQLLNGATLDGAYTDTNGITRFVNITANITDTSTNPLENSYCLVYQNVSRTVTSVTRTGSTAQVTLSNHNAKVGEYVIIRGANESDYNNLKQVTNVVDANTFEYTVSGTPTTPATGTITCQLVYLNGNTNASGIATSTVNYYSDQVVDIIIRKATGTYFKPSKQTGTITTNGLEIITSLISD